MSTSSRPSGGAASRTYPDGDDAFFGQMLLHDIGDRQIVSLRGGESTASTLTSLPLVTVRSDLAKDALLGFLYPG